MEIKIIAWFSAGVSSAVATKIASPYIDQIIYTHIEDQHPDTLRFVRECEEWFEKTIEILQSPYKTVENACKGAGGRGYVNGVKGAACTRILKKRVRKEWEFKQTSHLKYVWGIDWNEVNRCDGIIEAMPEQDHIFPLIDKKINKAEAHRILKASKIKRPFMYDLGYHNNNCIGCVKAGMGYWNHIRTDFPNVFKARAKMERIIGASCIKGVYLDELDPERGRHSPPVVDECGIFCEMLAL